MSEPLRVACASGEDYVPHVAAMLRSVLTQARRPVEAHFLHGPALPRRFVEALEAMVSSAGGVFRAHEIPDDRVAGLPVMDRIPVSMWYPSLLPELLPDAPRVLYLDADLLAVDDLETLWRTDLQGAWLGAVTNVLQPDHEHHPISLGLDPAHYFNSGVLLLNLDALRRDDRSAALLRYARERGSALAWGDQDALNAVLGERRLPLHPRFNTMNSIRTFPWAGEVLGEQAVAEARSKPAIIHFEGPDANKPWHVLCEHPERERYFAARRQTPWPRVRRDGRTPANLLRRALRDRAARR